MKTNSTNTTTRLACIAGFALTASMANAAVVVNSGNITTGSLVGSGLIIDTPTNFTTPASYAIEDQGWSTTATGSSNIGQMSQVGWEPGGAVANSPLYVRGTVTWTFDLADGTIINSVYANWTASSLTSATYSYSEATSGSTSAINHKVSAVGDLVYESANFQNLFTGPITVSGGNGFAFTADSGAVYMASDAVMIDFSPIPEPSSALLGGLGLLALLRRRR